MIQLLGDRALVRPIEPETRTASGLHIVDFSRGDIMSDGIERGVVVAVGPGAMKRSGERRPMLVGVGDRVAFPRHHGNWIDVDGVSHTVLSEADVLGVEG